MSKKVIRKTSNVNDAALDRLEKIEPRREDTPSKLALSDIHVADKVFQWRLPDEDVLADTRFVQELVDALEVQEPPLQPFEPLLVVPIGQRFFLVDGHHRLDAYATFGWKEPVPVEVFPGNLQDAVLEAWKRNAHNKLTMTKASRFEAAWKLVSPDNAPHERQTEHAYEHAKRARGVRKARECPHLGRSANAPQGPGSAQRRRLEASSGA